jgi:hypothetical protein
MGTPSAAIVEPSFIYQLLLLLTLSLCSERGGSCSVNILGD